MQYYYRELQYLTTAIRAALLPGLCLFGVALVLPAQQAGGKPETPSKAGDAGKADKDAGKADKKEPMASLEGQVVNSLTGDPLNRCAGNLSR